MKLDETTLIEIQDYIDALDEKVGLKPETLEDVRTAIDKHKTELKELRIADVSRRSEQLLCCCDNSNAFKEMEEGKDTCSKCGNPY
jgi:hypothetical protein